MLTRMKLNTKSNLEVIKVHNEHQLGRNYYCSMKFKYLKIDLESKMTYNCHAAKPHVVDFNWLKEHPGQIFNTDINVQERQQMLDNVRNASCEQNCWHAEDRGAISPRLEQRGLEQTHTNIKPMPEIIDLTINGDCNLTCSYCCKEFSSSWRRDIVIGGDYPLQDNRYQANNKDRVLLQISQDTLKSTTQYQILLNEIASMASTLKQLTITGGEPFLDNTLIQTLTNLKLNPNTVIEIYTGLGVSFARFKKIIFELEQLANVSIVVSAESTGEFLEFNRFGNKWQEFLDKVDLLKRSNVQLAFQCTLTNLTLFDIHRFYERFKGTKIIPTFAYSPTMMAPYVLDPASKEQVRANIVDLPINIQTMILDSIKATPAEEQRTNIGKFLLEFVRRRPTLTLDIFPQSFLTWLRISNVV